ncbi:MAG: sensor histidine kinase, partial [Planctomycetota bacterium]
FERFFETSDRFDIEYRIRHKNGHWIWLHDRATAIYQKDGVHYADGVFIDITERKKAEETLAQSEERYRGIFDESIASVYVFDEKKNFIDSNQAGLDLLGYSRDELLGMSIPDVDADPAVVLPAHKQLISGGKLVNYEHKLRRKDGTIITVLNNSRPLTDTQGNVIGLQSTLIDITERKKAEERLSAIVYKSPIPTAIGGIDGSIIAFNEALENLIGYKASEINNIEDWARKLYPDKEYREFVWKNIKQALDGKKQDCTQFTITRKDGFTRETDFHTSFFEDGLVVQIVDITDRIQAETALRERGAMLNTLLNAPLEIISLINKDGTVIGINESGASRFGKSPDEMIGHNIFQYMPRNVAQLRKNYGEEVFKTGKSIHFEDEREGKYFASSIYPVFDAEGEKVVSVAVFSSDITKRKLAEESLAQSEENYRSIFETANDAIFVHDAEDGSILDVNNKMLEMYGFDDKSNIVGSFIDNISSGEKPYTIEDAGKWVRRAVKEGPQLFEWHAKDKKGRLFWIEVNLKKAVIGGKDRILAIVRDISERKKAEEALRESEDRFRNIFNNAMVGLYRTTPDGRVLMANPAILQMLGYESFEELAKRNLEKEGFEPDYSRPDFKERIENEDQLKGFESAWRRRDNTIVYIRESARAIRDEFGNILYYEGIIEDITERKRAQEALDESAARLQLATSATRIGNWDWDLRNSKLYFSPEWKRQIGYEDHEIPNRYETWESRLHPEDKQSTVKALEDYIAGRQAEYGIEFRLRHKDGSYRWIYTRAEKQLDEAGKPYRLFGCHLDITERKKAEEELRRSEQDKALVLDNTNEIIAYHDLDHNIQWVNKAYLKATNRTFSELKGLKCYHAWELDRPCTNCPVTKAMETGESQQAELTPQNQKHWSSTQGCWMIRAAPVRNEAGSIIGAIEVAYDITERKQTEEELHQYQQRLKALASELTIAEERERRRIAAELHDNVQQSLALARIQLAAARRSTSADKLTAMLDEISESMRQALQNARNIVFDLSSPSMNEIGLAAAVSEWLSEQIQKRYGLKAEFIDECGKIQLDEDMRAILFRSVRELLTNVVKHAKASQVNVSLKHTGDYLEIVVKDDGIGFDNTAQSGNMGHFGLFSIQERMTDLGGSLEIESKPGNGSKVILKAPLNVQ